MVKVLSVASVLALVGAASASPFEFISMEAGGGLPGVVGGNFHSSFGGFFDADGSEVLSPAPNGFTSTNFQEFDTYFGVSGVGPSVRNRFSTGVANNSTTTLNFYQTGYPAANNNPALGDTNASVGNIVAPASHIGDLFLSSGNPVLEARLGLASSPPNTNSGFAPNVGGGRSTEDGVFLGRFTIPLGATLSTTAPVLISLNVSVGVLGQGLLELDGPGVLVTTGDGNGTVGDTTTQLLALRSYVVATHADGVLSGNSDVNAFGNFGAAKTIDVWLQTVQIPTPGALALLGLGGLVTIRRRRA